MAFAQKNRDFYVDSKFVEMSYEKCPGKKFLAKICAFLCFIGILHLFPLVYLVTCFRNIVLNFGISTKLSFLKTCSITAHFQTFFKIEKLFLFANISQSLNHIRI
jgi:hypothetical protein